MAKDIIEKAAYYGGAGLSMVIQILNPEVVVLGGGLIYSGPLLLDPMLRAAQEHSQPPIWQTVQIKLWELKEDAGIVGAAAQAFATIGEVQDG